MSVTVQAVPFSQVYCNGADVDENSAMLPMVEMQFEVCQQDRDHCFEVLFVSDCP